MRSSFSFIITALLCIQSVVPGIAKGTQPKWESSYFSGSPTLLGYQGDRGWASNGVSIVRFDLADGKPSDTIVPPSMRIDAIHEYPAMKRLFVIGVRKEPVPGTESLCIVLAYDTETGLLLDVVGLDPLGYGDIDCNSNPSYNSQMLCDVSSDGRFISIRKEGLRPPLDASGQPTYYYPLILVDVEDAFFTRVTLYGDVKGNRFPQETNLLRAERKRSLDLTSNEWTAHSVDLHNITQDTLYHCPWQKDSTVAVLGTWSGSDPNPLTLHSSPGTPITAIAFQWVVGSHILQYFPLDGPIRNPLVLDVSRNDTLLICEGHIGKPYAVAKIKDSSTIIIADSIGVVRLWKIDRIDLKPGTRVLLKESSLDGKQYLPVTIRADLYPFKMNTTIVKEWGDGLSSIQDHHCYQRPGQYTIECTIIVDGQPDGQATADVSITADQTEVQRSLWLSRLSTADIMHCVLSKDGARLHAIDYHGVYESFDALTGECTSIHMLPERGMSVILNAAGRPLGLTTATKTTSWSSWGASYSASVTAHDCSDDLPRARSLGAVLGYSWSSAHNQNNSAIGMAFGTSGSDHFLLAVSTESYTYGHSRASTGCLRQASDLLLEEECVNTRLNGWIHGVTLSVDSAYFLLSCHDKLHLDLSPSHDSLVIQVTDANSGQLVKSFRASSVGPCTALTASRLAVGRDVYDLNIGVVVDSLPDFDLFTRVDNSTIVAVDSVYLVFYDHTTRMELYREVRLPLGIKNLIYNHQNKLIHVVASGGYIFTLEIPPGITPSNVAEEVRGPSTAELRNAMPEVSFFPNPTSGTARIRLHANARVDDAEFIIVDSRGLQIFLGGTHIKALNDYEVEWDLRTSNGQLANGVYTLVVRSATMSHSQLIQILR